MRKKNTHPTTQAIRGLGLRVQARGNPPPPANEAPHPLKNAYLPHYTMHYAGNIHDDWGVLVVRGEDPRLRVWSIGTDNRNLKLPIDKDSHSTILETSGIMAHGEV